MADKEAGFIVWVEAQHRKGSGKEAMSELTHEVDSSVKGGRIKIPVDITIPIDETKSKLTKAQKEVSDEIKKMTTEGFSASGKDIDALSSKLQKFTQLAAESGITGKGKSNPTVKAIKQQVDLLRQQYKETKKLEKLNSTHGTKVKDTSTKTKKAKVPQDVIDKAMKAWADEIRERERLKNKYKD